MRRPLLLTLRHAPRAGPPRNNEVRRADSPPTLISSKKVKRMNQFLKMSSRSRAIGLVASALLVVGAFAGLQAQPGRGAQRGAAPAAEPGDAGAPNRLGQPLLDANGFVKDDAMLHAPALLPEDRKYADLDGKRMKQFLMEV